MRVKEQAKRKKLRAREIRIKVMLEAALENPFFSCPSSGKDHRHIGTSPKAARAMRQTRRQIRQRSIKLIKLNAPRRLVRLSELRFRYLTPNARHGPKLPNGQGLIRTLLLVESGGEQHQSFQGKGRTERLSPARKEHW